MLCVISCLFMHVAAAQSYKEARDRENVILDAVSDIDKGDYARARDRLEDVIAEDPGNDAAHYYKGMSAFMMSDYDTAEDEFLVASRLDSANFWYRYRLAAVYAVTDRKELTAEIYNGLPQENAAGYDDNSPINFADRLADRTRLLIMHGSADDNVHFMQSLEYAEALVQAGKQFDMHVYKDRNHGISGGNTRYHLYTKMSNYLFDNL